MLGRLFRRLFPESETEQSHTETDTAVETTPEAGNLVECPDCGTVYIGADLDTCAQCKVPVEPVETATELGWTR